MTVTKTPIPVTREIWTYIIDSIKAQTLSMFLVHVVAVLKVLLFRLAYVYGVLKVHMYYILHAKLHLDFAYILQLQQQNWAKSLDPN